MGLSGIDLNLLVKLDALLTERNVTRAAERTSVGQAAMSASLARLRKHFDDPLLLRDGRRLVTTPLADSLVEPVRDAIAAAEAVLGRSSGFDPSRDERHFTIVATDYVTMVLMRPLLAVLLDEAPGLRITVNQVDEGFADHLRRGRADLVILPTEIVGGGFAFPRQLMFTDKYVLVVDRRNRAVGDVATAEDLQRLRYVAYKATGMSPIVDAQLESQGINLNNDITTQEFVVAPLLVAGTQYASFVLERLAVLMDETVGLRVVETDLDLRPIHEAAYWHPRQTDDPAHRWLRNRLRRVAAKF